MSFAIRHNIAAYIKTQHATDNVSATAGGTGDNTLVTGQIIDRSLLAYPLSAMIAIAYKAVLAQAATLSLSYSLEHGDQANLSDAAALQSANSAVIETGGAGGSTNRGVFTAAVDLAGCKRYVRLKFTPDLSAANTDTAEASGQLIFGGSDTLP
jgi:hypothetical protein